MICPVCASELIRYICYSCGHVDESEPIKIKATHQNIPYNDYLKTAKKIKKVRTIKNKSKRQRIFERDKRRCLKCGSTSELTIDHIKPRAIGGSNDDDNLQTLCFDCNGKKGSKTKDYRKK